MPRKRLKSILMYGYAASYATAVILDSKWEELSGKYDYRYLLEQKRIHQMQLDIEKPDISREDEFIYEIVRSARMGGKIKIINANKGVSLMPVSGIRTKTRVMNPHSFISITSSIQQIYTIARELGQIDPANKAYYNKNAQAYAQKLRNMKAAAIKKVNHLKNLNMKVATSHAGYDYLLSEFGLRVRAVIEPAHGVEPSASDIKAIIDIIKRDKIDVVFVDAQVTNKYSTTIQKATGVRIRSLSHMSRGAYTKDSFERFMKYNLDSLTNAMLDVGKARGK